MCLGMNKGELTWYDLINTLRPGQADEAIWYGLSTCDGSGKNMEAYSSTCRSMPYKNQLARSFRVTHTECFLPAWILDFQKDWCDPLSMLEHAFMGQSVIMGQPVSETTTNASWLGIIYYITSSCLMCMVTYIQRITMVYLTAWILILL